MPPVVLWKQLTNERLGLTRPGAGAVVIRGANGAVVADRAAVRGLAEACRGAGGRGFQQPTAAGLAAELGSRPGRHVQAWLGALDGVGPPVGVATLVVAGPPPGRCSIGWLLVHPSARRRGVATALVAHALDTAQALGHDTVCIETLASWTDSVAFWHAMGFVAQA